MKKRRSRISQIFWLIPAVLWLAVLFYFSGQSGEESGELSGRLAEALLRHMPFLDVSQASFNFVLRKLAHFGIFAVEGFLLRFGLGKVRPGRWGNTAISTLIGGGIAVLNELHQLTSEGRACMPTDMLIDTFGVFVGAVFGAMVDCTLRELKRRRRRALDRRTRL